MKRDNGQIPENIVAIIFLLSVFCKFSYLGVHEFILLKSLKLHFLSPTSILSLSSILSSVYLFFCFAKKLPNLQHSLALMLLLFSCLVLETWATLQQAGFFHCVMITSSDLAAQKRIFAGLFRPPSFLFYISWLLAGGWQDNKEYQFVFGIRNSDWFFDSFKRRVWKFSYTGVAILNLKL